MKIAITSKIVQDPYLAGLSVRCTQLEDPSSDLDIDISLALHRNLLGITGSLDICLNYMRLRFPQPEWKYGLQDGGYLGYTGPTFWLNNGRCQIEGFDNHINYDYRYHERSARRIEFAAVATILLAESFRTVPLPCGELGASGCKKG